MRKVRIREVHHVVKTKFVSIFMCS